MSGLIETDSASRMTPSAGRSVPRQWLRLFLALGLVPGLYACRRLPLGLWQMAFGWSLILQLPVVIAYLSTKRQPRVRSVVTKIGRVLLVVTAVTLILNVLSALDAQEEPVPPEAGVFVVAVVLQILAGTWVVRSMYRRGADPVELRSTATALAAVVFSALILVPIGRSVPDSVLVLFVAVAAYRVARLRLDRTVPHTPVRRFVGQAVMFA